MKFSGYFLLVALVASSIARGQVAKGTPPYGSFSGGSFDTVNLGNLNVHFAIPVLHKAGRGMPFAYDISYDSSVWTSVTSMGTTQWQPDSNWGWRGTSESAIGYALQTKVQASCQYFQNNRWQTDKYWTYTTTGYGDQYGVLHPVHIVLYDDTLGFCQDVISSGSGTTTDGSGYTVFVTNFFQVTVTSKTGTVFSGVGLRGGGAVGSITDSNGNQITENTSGQFFDTLSSTTPVLTVAAPAPPTSTTFTYSAPSGSAVYSMNYQPYTVQTNFGTTTLEYGPLSNSLVSGIALPDGTSYSFTYEATPGSCTPLSGTYSANCVTGRIASVALATGGSITYAYSGGSNGIETDGSTAGLTRTVSPGGAWQYARSVSGSYSTTTITDPLLDRTVINFFKDGNPTYPSYNFYETQRNVSQLISGTQTLLETIITCYNTNYTITACPTSAVSSPISQTDSYLQLLNGSTRLSEVLYNGYGLATDDKEYDYGVTTGSAPGTTKLIRDAAIAYATLGNGIVSSPSSVTVSDWSSGSAVTLASTTYTYDGGSGVTGTVGTPQHVSITGSRGNLTTLSASTSATASLSRTYSYYDTGNLNVATDVNGAQTIYGYSGGSCGNAFPTGLTEPLSLSRSFTWNCVGGVMLTAIDENTKTVTADYSTDPDFWRPDYVADQLTNKTTFAYSTTPAAVESTLTFNGSNSVSDFLSTLDNLGRPHLSQRKQSPTAMTYDSVQTFYDVMGRVGDTMLPYSAAAGAICSGSCPKKAFTYDALNRPVTITDSGSGSISYQYIDNDVLQTVGPTQTFTKQMEYDGLGRLTSVCEVTAGTTAWPGGSCGQTNPQTGYLTKYTYDALGNLLTVKQNTQATTNQQTRKYSYDMLSRLTSEVNPETGNSATGVDIAYTYDSACGSYSASSGDLTKRVDKAGNTTCYGYDALHRLKDAGNAGPSCRHFRYDTQTPPSGVTVTNTLARQTEAYTDNCTSGKLTDEWFGYDADGNLTDFYESTPHSGGYYHTSVSYWANGAIDSLSALTAGSTAIFPTIYYGASTGTGLDGEGRVTKVSAASGTSPVTNVTYVTSGTTEPIGALTGVTLGSGDTDSFTLDPNTGRPLTYTFAVNSVNDKGSLIWSANGTLKTLTVTDSLAGTNDSQTCNYYYDDLTRLGGKDSNGYSVDCSTKWSQLFTFDPFGNISKSGSGGFAPTYSAATNQFTTIPGIVSPYYDANGNLTKDNLNTYAWDPNWGNPATINSTNLIYDANGQMVEQQNGSTYTQMLYSPAGKTAIMNGQTLNKAFVSLPGGGTAIYNSSGLAYYRHADWLGSSRLTSTAARTVYSASAYAPFGEQYGTSGTADASFTGQDADTTSSLYDFTFREHSPTQGRWISPDPLGLGASDPTTPQNWNRYAYVLNNPLTLVDPLGLYCNWDDGTWDDEDGGANQGDCESQGGTWVPGPSPTEAQQQLPPGTPIFYSHAYSGPADPFTVGYDPSSFGPLPGPVLATPFYPGQNGPSIYSKWATRRTPRTNTPPSRNPIFTEEPPPVVNPPVLPSDLPWWKSVPLLFLKWFGNGVQNGVTFPIMVNPCLTNPTLCPPQA